MFSKLALIVGLATSAALAPALPVQAAASPALLVNTLDSRYAVRHSLVGPALDFYRDGDCTANPYCAGAGIDVTAAPAFGRSPYGQALSIGTGPYGDLQREHNAVLRAPARVLSAEHGTIRLLYRQTASPVDYRYGMYRLFGGPYGLGEGIALWTDAVGGGRLHFGLGQRQPGAVEVVSRTDGRPGVAISGYNGRWIQIVATWRRYPAPGHATVRLTIDGVAVADTRATGWGSDLGPAVDIGGGNDSGIAGKFSVDNLVILS